MAKKAKPNNGSSNTKGGGTATDRAARKARKDEISQSYGKILYTSEYQLSPHLEADMARLCGPANSEGIMSLIAGILCAAIVLILMASQSNLPIAVVLVVITVVVMAGAHQTQSLKVRWLNKHGYNAALLSETNNTYTSFATASHVVVVAPDSTTNAYSIDEIKRTRYDANNCVASFGKGRVALFTRKSMGGAPFNELAESLARRNPATVGESLRARFGKK